jgi:hypothetical protein
LYSRRHSVHVQRGSHKFALTRTRTKATALFCLRPGSYSLYATQVEHTITSSVGRKNPRTSSKQRAAIRRPPRLGQLLGQPHGQLIFQLLGRKVSFPPCLRTAVPLSRSSKSFSPLLPFSIFVHDTVLLRLPSQPRSLQPHACSRAKWDRLGSGDSSQARGQFGRRQRLRA